MKKEMEKQKLKIVFSEDYSTFKKGEQYEATKENADYFVNLAKVAEVVDLEAEERMKQAIIIKAKNFLDNSPNDYKKESMLRLGYPEYAVEEVFKQKEQEKKRNVVEIKPIRQNKDEIIENTINWTSEFKCWKEIKKVLIRKLKESDKLFMIAHDKDQIIGKPQLISDVKITVPLVIRAERKIVDKKGNEEIKESLKLIDDHYDKRYDGYEKASYDESFYLYRVIFNDEDYTVFSKQRLDPEQYTFTGMSIRMNAIPQLNKELKIRGISKVFFAKEAHSTVKLISKEELIEFTKHLRETMGLDQEGFINLTFLHPDGKVYLHTKTYNLIRVAQLLSGKYEGYPLHLLNMGPLAKGKTKELEALDWKFDEMKGICEAGNSTPKVLVPSFKEKPATPGYILDCNRICLIDELMKMINNANTGTRQGEGVKSALGQLNMLLEHKKRTIGSGNDNSLMTKATAKCIFATNPLLGISFLKDHLRIVDDTTLSRMLCFVQDEEEQEFIQNNIPFECGNTYTIPYTKYSEKDGKGNTVYKSLTTLYYLLIYDNCQNFLCNFDLEKIRRTFKISVEMAKDPMKSVWKGRGLHHTILLLDGLVKFRCLFRDYDSTFTATDEDYDLLQGLLTRIVSSWDTDLSIKDGQQSIFRSHNDS
jgi:hypothetical protein